MNRGYGTNTMEKSGLTTLLISLSLSMVLMACWNPFSPESKPSESEQYYSPCDSAWKVLKNLQYAYVSRDIGHYLDCFRDDFEFHLLEIDWDDYDGDGIIDEYWGLDLEEAFHEVMFNNVSTIELTLSGDSQSPWTGDSTGQSLQLTRTFDLKVYTSDDPPEGFRASGEALFICRPDSTGEWYIWQWWDQSEF
ncbi:MAG: hypothetical protein AVO35_00810 [Candidatus Aegiribacteria sp. MLS_C]|nr:MAG: hypothetical protein AVO35_00810 [Candidatus Aegiribacteria sp. MLS_C]